MRCTSPAAGPTNGVDFTGKRVAVIGTGSSGVQSIPIIAEQARQLVVFQRTPYFSIPAHNGPLSPEQARPAGRRRGGLPRTRQGLSPAAFRWSAASDPDLLACRRPNASSGTNAPGQIGELFEVLNVYADVLSNRAANDELAEFFRDKIRSMVDDPQTASTLCPTDYPDRHQAAVPGHGLLRHLQPAACAPGRPATRTRFGASPKPASTPSTSPSSSTRSCSPPASTR